MNKWGYLALAVGGIAVVWAIMRGRAPAAGPTTIYQAAPRRTDAESILTGIGNLAEGLGAGVGSIMPRLGWGGGPAANSSSGGGR